MIFIRNGGILSFSLSNAISRAVSRLIIFMPDDHKILKECCKKNLLIKQEKKKTILETLDLSNDDLEVAEITSRKVMSKTTQTSAQSILCNPSIFKAYDDFRRLQTIFSFF